MYLFELRSSVGDKLQLLELNAMPELGVTPAPRDSWSGFTNCENAAFKLGDGSPLAPFGLVESYSSRLIAARQEFETSNKQTRPRKKRRANMQPVLSRRKFRIGAYRTYASTILVTAVLFGTLERESSPNRHLVDAPRNILDFHQIPSSATADVSLFHYPLYSRMKTSSG